MHNSQNMETFQASDIVIERSDKPAPKLDLENLGFGQVSGQHMLEIDWTAEEGWSAPKISERHNLVLDPAASALHYGSACFEGMKAYTSSSGEILLFRPELNFKRLNESCTRVGLPSFDVDEAVKCLKELLKVDKNIIPQERGFSLYIRPTCISTYAKLGLATPAAAKFFIITSPSGPYFKTGFGTPVTLYADTKHIRAFKGGVGCYKLAGNYAPTLLPAAEAKKQHGVAQVLWTSGGEDPIVNEVGAMNIFFIVQQDDGVHLITPQLDGTILPGITRRSILELAKEKFIVEERDVYLRELVQWSNEGNLLEMAGCGTAAIVVPVKSIKYNEDLISVQDEKYTLSAEIYKQITDIQYGFVDHEWSVSV